MNHVNKTFTNKTERLCGNAYTRCTFDDCVLVYDGTGPVGLNANFYKNDTHYQFDGPALRTLAFLSDLYAEGGHHREIVENIFVNIRNHHFPREPVSKSDGVHQAVSAIPFYTVSFFGAGSTLVWLVITHAGMLARHAVLI